MSIELYPTAKWVIDCELITEEFGWLLYRQNSSEIDSASTLIFSRSWNREQIKKKNRSYNWREIEIAWNKTHLST